MKTLAAICVACLLWLSNTPQTHALNVGFDSTPTEGSQVEDPQSEDRQPEPATTVAEEIVVSAHRIESPRDTVGSSVTVIDRHEIEGRQATTVLDLLRTTPGLAVVQGGGAGRVTSVFIRGGNSNHTLVVVDGVRINDNTTGAVDFADLTTDNIERIEILRGPQGTLYGSEAVAGVISITTHRGNGPAAVRAAVEAGSDGYSRLRAGVQGGGKSFDYNVSVGRVDTDGVSAASEQAGNQEEDPWQNLTVSTRLGTVLGNGNSDNTGRFDLTLRYVDAETGLDGFTFGVGPTDDLNYNQFRESLYGGLTFVQPFGSKWKQTFFVGSSRDELEGEDPDTFFNNFAIDSETVEVSSQSDITLSADDTLTVGFRYEDREAESVGSFDESVDVFSVFVQNLWSVGERFHLTLGVRNDDHSQFGDETTYRATMSLLFPNGGTRLHGSYGTGFKAPTFNELYFPFFGNPNLEAETNEGFDFGVEKTFSDGRWVLDATYFDNQFEDLILFGIPTFANVQEATTEGFEVGLVYRAEDRLLLRATHTYTDSENLATGEPLARRPKSRSTLSVDYRPVERLRGVLAFVAVSDRIDADGSTMDDYERLDMTLTYEWKDRFRPYLRIENLLDQDYEEIPGFTTPGATGVIGFRLGR